jgi:hypothetical protein
MPVVRTAVKNHPSNRESLLSTARKQRSSSGTTPGFGVRSEAIIAFTEIIMPGAKPPS